MEVIFAVLAVLIIIPIVGLIAEAIAKSREEKLDDLLEELAPNDIKKIKKAMMELGITVPADSYSNTSTLKIYIEELCKYVYSKVDESVPEGCASKYFPDALLIFYDKNQVIILSDLLFHFCNNNRFLPKIYATENGIKYFGTKEKKDGMSISTVIDNVKKLDDKDFIKSNTNTVKWDDLIWYLNGVPHMLHVGNVGAGAIGGALLLGPIGAVAGAISGNKDANEAKQRIEREMKLMFGYCGGKKWVINTNWNRSSFQDDFKFFLETCPDRRAKDIERSE
jgi:hypothetical protein